MLFLLSSHDDIYLPDAAAIGANPVQDAASRSGVLQGVVDAMSGAVAVVGDISAQASDLVGLAHEHLMPEGTDMPNGLSAHVAAFSLGGERMVELVAESVVSGHGPCRPYGAWNFH